ncbi:hypothetical protein DAPPUDRAFT_304384 [Daphnia pulex]|uniref:Uncharacterized protein n=1 Tax=Daphnia pulex TaxID=6669 RepID=E9GLA6_DAPPU|nr:hypothetical protein DAPPUDRAFT_304384 [Daphnia pulex]|eukprot:EFX79827.1 hypothetical protein DAPPUDRAFT_304384 [Daphnia pulex]
MKIWLIVALLAVATSVAVAAAVAAEADSTKTAATKVIAEAETETDLPPTSTDVAGDDEGSEASTTESSTAEDENNEKKKMKHDKSEPIKEGEPEEEEEGENEEEENEESEEGDSDEDSEEEESKGKERKNKTKIESEEEGTDHRKEDAGKMKFPKHQPPAQVPTRSRTFATPAAAAASPVAQPDKTHREPKWFFNSPNSKSTDVLVVPKAKVESPKFDFTETSTRAAVHHQVWSSSARPVAKSVAVETRPATTRPTDVTPSDTRKPHHPKWFFNTAKEKSSAADGSTKIESHKPTAIFEIPTRKAAAAAAISIPSWPSSITTAKPALPAVASNEPADFSHSDNRRSHSHWYFNTPSKPSADGFAKKESNTKPAAIGIPTRNGRPDAGSSHHATHPWTPSSSNWPVASVPVYKPVLEVTPPPPRKQYPRWFFNIKS